MHSATGILLTRGVFRYFTTILSCRETTQSTNDGTHKFLSLGFKKPRFPILLPKSNPLGTHLSWCKSLFYFIQVHSYGSRVTLKQLLPLRPGELVVSPDWAAGLERRGWAVTRGQGGTAGSCCLWSRRTSCSPRFSCLPQLSIHPELLRTETLMWTQISQSIWNGSQPISYYFATQKRI